MNDLPDFEVLENVSSPFEDDPFEQDPLETEESNAEEQAAQPENTPVPENALEPKDSTAPEQPVQESPVPAAAPAEASVPPVSGEAAPKTTEDPQTVEARKRAEHEAAEAKRKAEWEAKQAEKQAARQAALEKIRAMNEEQLIRAATEKASQDTEKLTRRNMKECICEYIQTLCLEDPEFARLTLTPPKNMVRCFQYINRKAWEYVQDELKVSGQTPGPGAQGYSDACGRTGHHYKDGMAYKFEDELFETVLLRIEWNPTRTGEIAPVAVFEPVQIDGCEVSRASLHNLNFIRDLQLKPGCRVLVSKRNQIIPHIEGNLDRAGDYNLADAIPRACPCCGQTTRVHVSRRNKTCATMTLFCDNERCETRRLRQFMHFAGKKAMNIEGLSEAALEKLIGRGWLHSYMDVYRLDSHAAEIAAMDGFGEKSWQNLWAAIQRSRDTTFVRYLVAMDIPLVGRTASGVLAKQFDSDLGTFEEEALTGYDFTRLPDFGEALNESIHTWFEDEDNLYVWEELQTMVTIQKPQPESGAAASANNPFAGKNVVVTGKVEPYTRSEMNSLIESLGAHAQSAVSGKTDYLVCGESAGSKLAKARQLGVTVLTPNLFFSMAQDAQEGTV